jgi:hypothetical protein
MTNLTDEDKANIQSLIKLALVDAFHSHYDHYHSPEATFVVPSRKVDGTTEENRILIPIDEYKQLQEYANKWRSYFARQPVIVPTQTDKELIEDAKKWREYSSQKDGSVQWLSKSRIKELEEDAKKWRDFQSSEVIYIGNPELKELREKANWYEEFKKRVGVNIDELSEMKEDAKKWRSRDRVGTDLERDKIHSQEHHDFWWYWCATCGHHVKNHINDKEYCLDGKLMFNGKTKEYEQEACGCRAFKQLKRIF